MKITTRIGAAWSGALSGFLGKVSQARTFNAAAMNRLTSDWVTLTTSADADLRNDIVKLRARSRQLERDDPYMQRYLKLIENNVIGSNGVKLQMKVRDPGGRMDEVANTKIEDAWKDWTKKESCSVTGQLTLHEISRICLRAVARDGGILIRKVKGPQWKHGFALQIIEIDFLDVYYNVPVTPSGNEIRMGVELDQWKRPVAYHLWTRHPGDYYAGNGFHRIEVPASEIIHLYRVDRSLQSIGLPWITPSMYRLRMLGGMEEAALVAYRAAACQGGWFKKSVPEGYTGNDDGNGNIEREVEPALWTDLPPGIDPVVNNPNFPGTSYSEYTKAALRGTASGLGVSYNSLANDLEGVNYSSIRAGVMEDREEFKQIQQWLIDSFFHPIFVEWLPMAILSGRVTLPFSKLDKFQSDTWVPRRWGWVDPMKDIQAKVLAIDNLLESRTDTLAESGDDFDEMIETLKTENEVIASSGLKVASSTKAEPEDDKPKEEN